MSIACVICAATVTNTIASITTHSTSAHPVATVTSHVLGGNTTNFATQNDVTQYIIANSVPAVQAPPAVAPVPVVTRTIAQRMGIMMTNVPAAVLVVGGTGGVATEKQGIVFFEAVKAAAGYDVDNTNVFLCICQMLLTADATDNLSVYGEFRVEKAATVMGNVQHKFLKLTDIFAQYKLLAVSEHVNVPTLRQLARLWAPAIMEASNLHPELKQLEITGTPMSAKYDIDSANYRALLSFFPQMKNPSEWTPDEDMIFKRHARDVVKTVAAAGSKEPTRMAPDPTLVNAGLGFMRSRLQPTSEEHANATDVPSNINPLVYNMLNAMRFK